MWIDNLINIEDIKIRDISTLIIYPKNSPPKNPCNLFLPWMEFK